jgi:hypothetical protein
MRQNLQGLNSGETEIAKISCPSSQHGRILIHIGRSLFSFRTERMRVDSGKTRMTEKARRQPDKVRMVLEKIKANRLLRTLEEVL